jgi:hypothetical protein
MSQPDRQLRAGADTLKEHRNVRRLVLELAEQIRLRRPELDKNAAIEQALEQFTKGMTLQDQMRVRALLQS